MTITAEKIVTKEEKLTELMKEGKSFLRYSMVESLKVGLLRNIAKILGIENASKRAKAELVREIFYSITTYADKDDYPDEKREWEKRWALATMEGKKLNQEQFRCLFMTPLEIAFGFRAYWNGKEAEEQGFHFSGNYKGWSCTSRDDAPVVIRFLENQQGVLRTLVHEYAHSMLHRSGTDGRSLHENAKEVEAETVAKEVVIRLGLDYHNDWYIPHHQKKYQAMNGCEYVCRDEVYACIEPIVDALWDVRAYMLELPGKHEALKRKREAKYSVLCPCCDYQWNYKRRAKIIDKDARGYWCQKCGKEKTYNRLKVIKRMV